ncbi:primosomal protein DnaI [Streptococcus cameli]
MKNIQDKLHPTSRHVRKSYQEICQEILADSEVSHFVQLHQLDEAVVERSISKFFEYIKERDKWLSQDQTYIAKGYKPILIMNEGYADVSYQETAELVEAQRQDAIRRRMNLVELPASLKQATLKPGTANSVQLTNGRAQALTLLNEFIANFTSQEKKGLYVYGDFGVGKSFLLAALAHDLSERYGVGTTMLHYPSFVVNVKNAIQTGQVKTEIDAVKQADILILDDIGAEQHSPWVRDDVLQVILQHRMQENLPTFFTSNFSFADLEKRLSQGKSGDETWQAKRVMERIRFLAKEVHLEGENQRHE